LGVFKNLWLTGGIFLSIVLQMAVIYLPSLQSLFRTVAIAPSQLLSMVIVASSVLWSEEIRKLMVRRWK
jgi:Ca2+-transporting ATPase